MVHKLIAALALAGTVFVSGYLTGHYDEHTLYCQAGPEESDCQFDFRGKGKWVLEPATDNP